MGWLKRLPATSVIAMEATGGYQELLASTAHERGFEVYVLNPTHVHHYAISLGNRGKTDRLDSAVIAQYIAQHHKNCIVTNRYLQNCRKSEHFRR